MYGGSVVNSNFIKNHANKDGGAVYDSLVANCLFEYNSAENGGAMSKGRATNCTFNNNNATNLGEQHTMPKSVLILNMMIILHLMVLIWIM